MAPLTFDIPLRFLGPVYTEVFPISLDVYPTQFWKGMPVIMDISADDGGVVPMDGVTMTTGDVALGIAAGQASSVAGQTEASEVETYVWPTIVGFPDDNLDFSDIGKAVSKSDSNTLSTSGGAYPVIGTLYTIRDGYSYVLLYPPSLHS